jgi:hypothetical protein
MSKKNKLGQRPAFASQSMNSTTINVQEGISKRFYAACAAMQGLLSNAEVTTGTLTGEELIDKCYLFADELLKQEDDE